MKIKISSIAIEERQREDLKDIMLLSKSIEEVGQLVPIIVEKGTNRLIAGERRIQAMRLLGRDEVDAVFQEDLTEAMRYKIELMENLMRENLSWDEEVKAIAELARLEQAESGQRKPGRRGEFDQSGAKSLDDIAKGLGMSKARLSQDLTMANALETFPRLAEEPNKTTAFKRYKRALSSVIASELLTRGEINTREELKLGKAEELIVDVGDGTIDLVTFDPPFGIELDTSASQGISGSGEDYKFEDTLERSRKLCSTLFPQFFRVMKPDSVLLMFYPIQYYQWFYDELVKTFGVDGVFKIPLIWNKGRGGTLFTGYSFSGSYETIFFARKGKPVLSKDRGDVFNFTRVHGQKLIHVAERPVELYKEMIECATHPGASILDPTFGSAASIEAAMLTNRKAIGFEEASSTYARACTRISAVAARLQSAQTASDVEEG